MRKHISANTMKSQDVSLDQEGLMRVDNVDMVIPKCVYIFRQEGVKRVIIAIFTMEVRKSTTGVKTSILGEILMETDKTIQMPGNDAELPQAKKTGNTIL